jgi:HJR/Mrr/RecB family endonuclease
MQSFPTDFLVLTVLSIPIVFVLIHVFITTSALKEWREWRALWSRQYDLSRREASLDLSRTARMNGRDFESYVAEIFRETGFHVDPRGGPRDQGCDLLLSNGNESVVCQIKRSSRPVTNKPVQEAVAAVLFYNANRAMVVTNATFTRGARDLAFANRCELVDCQELQLKVATFSAKIKFQCKIVRDRWAERVVLI